MSLLQQVQQELQNELTLANQLLRSISIEMKQIKDLTKPGGKFEETIVKNASLTMTLANIHHIDLVNILPVARTQIDMNNHTNQDVSYERHDTFRNNSNMDDTQ